ncbi:MAG: PRC-barrel domain-containing protein [Lacunisphaera sp.]
MLQNIKELYGDRLAASDGEIGHVKDFYFDDKSWVVRYAVADTGTWLRERQVLLSPHAFGHVDRDRKIVTIQLTRKQIEDSPSIELHQPVSRQFEQNYYDYYGWPAYWEGGGMWGVAGFPVVDRAPSPKAPLHHGHNQRDDLHLRSTKAVAGYKIQASDGTIGSVRGFIVDDQSWAIGEMVVETGRWYSGKEVLISPAKIQRVSYDESKIFVNLTKSEIERTAKDDIVKVRA